MPIHPRPVRPTGVNEKQKTALHDTVEAAKFLRVDEPRFPGQINEHAEHDDAP